VIVAKDRVGLLARISKVLSNKKVNIESVSVETLSGDAVIHLVASKEDEAIRLLKDAGFKVVSSDIFILKIVDAPGELAKVAGILADAGVGIRSVHFIRKEDNMGLFAVRVDKADEAAKLLKDYI